MLTSCLNAALVLSWFKTLLLTSADVGGFVEDPEEELLLRWHQAAALQPFFRNHSSKWSRRREPWLSGSGVTTAAIRVAIQQRSVGPVREAAKVPMSLFGLIISGGSVCVSLMEPHLRYCLLPYWYTLFHQAHTSGLPPLRLVLLPSAGNG